MAAPVYIHSTSELPIWGWAEAQVELRRVEEEGIPAFGWLCQPGSEIVVALLPDGGICELHHLTDGRGVVCVGEACVLC